MGRKGRSQCRDGATACFYSNLCKWACLHYAGFLYEARSQTDHSVGPQGPERVAPSTLISVGTRKEGGRILGGGVVWEAVIVERERNPCTRAGISDEKSFDLIHISVSKLEIIVE